MRLSLALRVMGIARLESMWRHNCSIPLLHVPVEALSTPGQETTLSALTMTSVQTKQMTASTFTHKTLKYEINGVEMTYECAPGTWQFDMTREEVTKFFLNEFGDQDAYILGWVC